MRVSRLTEMFEEHYEPEMLALLHSDSRYSQDISLYSRSWWVRLLQMGARPQPPLRHLLLMRCLGYSAEEFFGLSVVERQPFGAGPWPCLNKGAAHHGQMLITEYTVLPGRHNSARFSCPDCAFTYRLQAREYQPHQETETLPSYSSIVSFVTTWETNLRQLWNDNSLSLREMAGRLGQSESTVKKQAALLGMPFPRARGFLVQPMEKKVIAANAERKARLDKEREALRTQYRDSWLDGLRRMPNATLTILRAEFDRHYVWLYRYDHEWLLLHLPSKRPRKSWSRHSH